jgi:hypothetical protein
MYEAQLEIVPCMRQLNINMENPPVEKRGFSISMLGEQYS